MLPTLPTLPRTRLRFPQPDGNGLNGEYRAASVVLGEVTWTLTDGQLAREQHLLKDFAAQATSELGSGMSRLGNYHPAPRTFCIFLPYRQPQCLKLV